MSQLSKYLTRKTLVRLNEVNRVALHFEDGSIVLAVYNPLSVVRNSIIISCDALKTFLPLIVNDIIESHVRAVLFFDHGISIDIDLLATSNTGPETMSLRIGSEGFVVW